jgi:parallel beta-helix repeat protein
MGVFRKLSFSFFAALTFASLPAFAAQYSITVNDYPSGTGPTDLVSQGIPFKPGELTNPLNFRVLDGATEVPIGFRVLARWPTDNSIRVALVQFAAPFAGSTKNFTIDVGGPARTTAARTVQTVTWRYPRKIVTQSAAYLSASLIAWEQKPLGTSGFATWEQRQQSEFARINFEPNPSVTCARTDQYYDSANTSQQYYARTGQLAPLINARRWAHHHRSHQVYLSGASAGHGICTSGNYINNTRYVFPDSLVRDYFMWGDDESLRVAKLIVDSFYIAYGDQQNWWYKAPNERGFWTEREPAFALLGIVAYYEASGDATYLERARTRVASLRRMQAENGNRAWVHNLYDHDPSEGCPTTAWGSSSFMSGLLLEGLIRYHKLTGDAVARDSILWAVDDLRARNVATGSGAGLGFIYLGCPSVYTDAMPDIDNLLTHAWGYAYRLSGFTNTNYLNFGRGVFNNASSQSFMGASKQYNQQLRTSGHFVAYIDSAVLGLPRGTTTPTVSVTVSPDGASLQANQTRQFTASVSGTTNTGVTWTRSPAVGTISTSGLYTAPSSITSQQVITIRATSVADPTRYDETTLTLVPTAAPITVTVSPDGVSLQANQTRQYTASITGTTNTGVTWTRSPAVGTLSTGGLYTAPSSITSQQVITIRATSVADTTRFDETTLTLVPTTAGVQVIVTPGSVTEGQGRGIQFSASVTGTANTGVTWSISPTGRVGERITTSGLYQTPASITTAMTTRVRATSVADPSRYAEAVVNLIPPPAAPAAPASAPAQTLYVTATGNDANACTQTAPCRQVRRAIALARNNTTILVGDGQYLGFTIQEKHGLATERIVIRATGSNAQIMPTTDRLDSRDNIIVALSSYITIEGLRTSNAPRAGISVNQSHFVTLRNNVVSSNGRWGIFLTHSNDPLLEGNDCSLSGTEHGMYFSNSADRPVVRGNRLHDNAGAGLHVNADLSWGGGRGVTADGVITGALIENNVIYNNGNLGAGINMDGVQSSVVRNNLLYNNHAGGITMYRIDGAQGPANNDIQHNTFDMASDARWTVLVENSVGAVRIRNNIFYNRNTARGGISLLTSADMTNVDSNYNLFGGSSYAATPNAGSTLYSLAQWQAQGKDASSRMATLAELFVGAPDYHLRTGSPAINTGLTLASVTRDLEGRTRPQGTASDIGAYEVPAAVAAGTLQFTASAVSIGETGSAVTLSVSRVGGSAGAVGVSFATSNGTALAGSDFTAQAGALSWAAGDTASKSITIAVTNDTATEANETFGVTLANPTGGATLGSPASTTVTILANDATTSAGTLQLNVSTLNAPESTGSITVWVNRLNGSSGPVSVSFATVNGSALSGSDYTGRTGILSWVDGETTGKGITIAVTNDTAVESNESFTISLNTPTGGATLGSPVSTTVTIQDNDAASTAGALRFSTSAVSVAENGGSVTLTVHRVNGSSGAVSVAWNPINGTAVAGFDYVYSNGTLSWAAGDIAPKTITLPIINDTTVEGSQTFSVALASPTNGATLGSPISVTVTILDDDTAPTTPGTLQFTATTASVSESGGSVSLSISRTGGSSGAISVSYAASNGTALAGSDFTAQSGTLSWAAGDTANKTISIPVINDTVVENAETFRVAISNPLGGSTLGTATSVTITIQDNDTVTSAPAGTVYGMAIPARTNGQPRLWFTGDRLARARTWLQSNTFTPAADDYLGWAMRGRLNNSSSDCRVAINWALNFTMSTAGTASNDARWHGEAIYLTYDWCYDYMTTTERQTLMDRWNTYNETLRQKIWGAPTMVANNYHWGYLRNMMAWGIMSQGENSMANTFLQDALVTRWQNNFLPYGVNQGRGGVPNEGSQYGPYLFDYSLIPFETARLYGRPIHNESNFFREAVFYNIYGMTNGASRNSMGSAVGYELFPFSDNHTWRSGASAEVADLGSFMTVAAMRWESTPVGQFARRWLNVVTPGVHRHVRAVDDNPTAPGTDFSNLPLDYYASGPGVLFGRSSWTPGSAQFHLQLGDDSYGVGHNHDDWGFQIWRGGRWISRETSGYGDPVVGYNGVGTTGSGETIGHNGILINGSGVADGNTNGPAVVTRLESRPLFTYASANLSNIYRNNVVAPNRPERDNPAARNVVREFIFIRPLETMVVFDRLESNAVGTIPAANVVKTFLMHFETVPTVNSSAREVTAVIGDQAARLVTLVPSNPTYQVVAEGGTIGQHRLEVNTSGTAQSYFLQFIQAKAASAANVIGTVTDNGSSYTLTLSHPTQGRAVIVLNKGMTSSGGTISINGAVAQSLANGVQTLSVTDNGPVWGTVAVTTADAGITPDPVVAGGGAGAVLSQVKVYPNPWRANGTTNEITFSSLPNDSLVQIFSVSGHLVAELKGSGDLRWDRQVKGGGDAASGLYIYRIETPASGEKRGKLAIIR